MALTFFEDTSSTAGELPFLNEFIKKAKNLKTQQYEVKEIKKTRKDKGYLVITDRFSCYIWKNAKEAGQLIEALDLYINGGKGYAIFVYLPDPKKDDFKLAVDFEQERTWYAGKNGYTTTLELASITTVDGTNPFLPPN